MRKGQTHPSTLYSKNRLGQALVQLLEERAFGELTVTELCERAEIARRTFYRHFATLEDVLAYYVQGVIADFVQAMRSRSLASDASSTNGDAVIAQPATTMFEELVLRYFSFWQQHSTLLIQLNKNQLLGLIFAQYIQCLHHHPDILHMSDLQQADREFQEPRMAYVSGGLWSALIYWVSAGCRQTPQELSKIIAGK